METKTSVEYRKPHTEQKVTRFDHCPCFEGRNSLFAIEPICWFCKFAKFDLFNDKLPEQGVCKYPVEQ